ncbi:MAG: dockerin type I repeat-containing protein, partial [Oscillospiraceae bacterium]|nr:dockerin type I repeat-containing protein [Oscillospiraceae bacterium]
YVYRAPEGYEGDETLKWYKAENVVDANGNIQSGYWLPSVKAAFEAGKLSIDINGSDSLASLLYSFAPYIFAEMAPTVLNGSAKKLIAEAFDVKFDPIGEKGSAEVAAEVAAIKAASGDPGDFFTKAQGYYTWEYTDYKVITTKDADGNDVSTPYYRYQDKFFKGTLPSNLSAYYAMFNWDWNISADFLDEFIPGNSKNTKGYAYALDGLNDLIGKAIKAMIKEDWSFKDKEYSRDDIFAWTEGGKTNTNAPLLDNILNVARKFFTIAPEEIFDEYFMDAQFAKVMMETGTKEQATKALIAQGISSLLMKQIYFPDNIVDQPMTAIAAVVVRELCTQLMPSYNFDAMIYTNYGNSSNGGARELAKHSADEWLDITLYMGVNLGMYYLRNITDIGEDADTGYYSVMANLGALPALTGKNTTSAGDKITFTENSYKATDGTPSWLVAVDWIVDWALDENTIWAWHFGKFVDAGSTVDLATYQNPFNKLNTIFLKLFPALENLLNTDGLTGSTYGSKTVLEKLLKDGLVDSIVNLDVNKLVKILHIPANSILRSGNIADTLVQLLVNLLNGITSKVAGMTLIPAAITSVNTLLNQANIRTTIVNLVGQLGTAYNNGLLVPLLPIFNFFVGWTTDPQKYADPNMYFANDWNATYLYSTNNPTLNIINAASGMLLTHRGSSTTDTAYSITVSKIEFTNGVSTSQAVPFTVSPGENKNIPLTVPGENVVSKVTITYQFKGKDNKDLGGTQTAVNYVYVSGVTDQLNEMAGGVDKDYTQNNEYRLYEFTKDIYGSVTNYMATVSYKKPTVGATFAPSSKSPASLGTNGAAVSGIAANYFVHRTNYTDAGFVTVYKEPTDTKPGSSSGYLYDVKAGVDENTEFPYGVYDMGTTTIKYGSSGKDYTVDFIYYNDFNVDRVAVEYTQKNLQASQFKDQTKWAAYEAALIKVVELAGVAKRTDYVDTVQPQIEPAIEALENAYDELMKGGMVVDSGDVSEVDGVLQGIETGKQDLNFQDYKLFEYFQYEKQRTSAREMIKSTKGPEEPQKYIDSVWGDKLVEAIIASKDVQANEVYKKAIPETVEGKTADDMKAYEDALADFVPATYTKLETADQKAKLTYYYNFMKATLKTADMTFINKEIAYAEAQNYVQADYSVDSWNRYTEALANAKHIAGTKNALPHEVFDAKYELMVSQNELLEKYKSMKDNVESAADDYENIHTDRTYLSHELNELIKVGTAIVNYYSTSKYKVNPEAGVSEKEALEALVRALGVPYSVTVDGEPYKGILYDYSALTFQEYDRINSVKNKRAVDAAADKLRQAISYFTCEAEVVENDPDLNIVSNNDVLLVVGFQPNAITTTEDITDRVDFIAPKDGEYTLDISASKAGFYGTGTCLKITDETDTPLVSYYVVIFGDVNGDGAVDAFDALEVDHAYHDGTYHMGAIYDDAADLNHDGIIDSTDYGMLVEGVQCVNAIDQTLSAAGE